MPIDDAGLHFVAEVSRIAEPSLWKPHSGFALPGLSCVRHSGRLLRRRVAGFCFAVERCFLARNESLRMEPGCRCNPRACLRPEPVMRPSPDRN